MSDAGLNFYIKLTAPYLVMHFYDGSIFEDSESIWVCYQFRVNRIERRRGFQIVSASSQKFLETGETLKHSNICLSLEPLLGKPGNLVYRALCLSVRFKLRDRSDNVDHDVNNASPRNNETLS